MNSYIVCLVRLLNGLNQINSSPFHRYEKEILVEPMELFCKYFLEQVDCVFPKEPEEEGNEQLEPIQKEAVLKDIETALSEVASIYERVINATSNADKQLFMSMPLNSTIYWISPKLYAMYEELISSLVKLYSASQIADSENNTYEYAFFLKPSLKHALYTQKLFEQRKGHGSVVVIHLPVMLLENTKQMSLYLMHEIFHILPSKQRCRKKRATELLVLLIDQLYYIVFDNVKFSADAQSNREICKKLYQGWIFDAKEKFKRECEGRSEDDCFFYSKNICVYLEKLIYEIISHIDTWMENDIMQYAYHDLAIGSDHNWSEGYSISAKSVQKCICKIRNNIVMARCGNVIPDILDKLRTLFRELFSDLACLYTSNYKFDEYKKAFHGTLRLKEVSELELSRDLYYKLRLQIMEFFLKNVEAELKNYEDDALQDYIERETCAYWEAWNFKQVDNSREAYNAESIESSGQEGDFCVNINMQFINSYIYYLSNCWKMIDRMFHENHEQKDLFAAKLLDLGKPTKMIEILSKKGL